MKTQVSQSTARLLVILSITLIAAVFFQYGMMPSIDRYNNAVKVNSGAKERQRTMEYISGDISDTNTRLQATLEQNAAYRKGYKEYGAAKDIEGDLTRNMMLKRLTPLAVAITPKPSENPDDIFERFNVELRMSGSLDGIHSLCGYVYNEFSYRLLNLRITSEDEVYEAVMVIEAVYVKAEDGDTQDAQ